MRSPTDRCLLCRQRTAIKKQSHIIPRFIGKSIFGTQKRQAFMLDSAKAYTERPKIVQDIAKEDYIVCPECERYFEILETYVASHIQNRLWDVRWANDFGDYKNEGGVRYKICLKMNPVIFRLFIYSIIWRCSISETYAHSKFNLDKNEEEKLRRNLLIFFSKDKNDLLEIVENKSKELDIITFLFYTSETFNDKTSNLLFTHPGAKNPYHIELNEYVLLFTFGEWENYDLWSFLLNDDTGNIKIGFFHEAFWKELKNDLILMFKDLAEANQKL